MDLDEAVGGADAEQLLGLIAAAADALAVLPGSAYRLTGRELDRLLAEVDRLAALAAATRFTVTAEAASRGEIASSTAGTVATWVTERCPRLSAWEVGSLARAVRELAGHDVVAARSAVEEGRLSVLAGTAVATELRAMRSLLDPDPGVVPAVVDGLVAMGVLDGTAGVRAVRPALLARYGRGELLQREEDRTAGLTTLTRGRDIGGGVREYRLRLAAPDRAVLDTAVDAVARSAAAGSAATTTDSEAERDRRTDEQRRGHALVELCRRALAVTRVDDLHPGPPGATVVVTMDLDDLVSRTRPGLLLGSAQAAAGAAWLGPETVRRLACDARIIPAVLGSSGRPLELGRTTRLFTSGQVTALWLRDRHCTYPGCAVPAAWCDAHHLVHWADGGPTDFGNAALLCGRHHTTVHRDRLAGSSAGGPVVWDRTPGSYDRQLARGPTERPAA